MQAHFIWQLAFLLHGQPCATASSTVPGSEPFLFLFFSAVFFLCVQVRIVISQTKKEKKEKQRNIFFVIYHLCAVYSYFSLNGTVASPSVGSAPSAAARSHPSFSTCAL